MLNGTHSPSRISFLFLLSTSFPALPPRKENSTKKVSREHFFFPWRFFPLHLFFPVSTRDWHPSSLFWTFCPHPSVLLLVSFLFILLTFLFVFCAIYRAVMQISKPNTLPPSFQSMHQGDGDLPVWVLIGSRRGSWGVVIETFYSHWWHEARPLYDCLDLLSLGWKGCRACAHSHTHGKSNNQLLARCLYLFQCLPPCWVLLNIHEALVGFGSGNKRRDGGGEKGRFQKGGSQRDGARITSDGPIFSFGLQHVPISLLGTEYRLPFFFSFF